MLTSTASRIIAGPKTVVAVARYWVFTGLPFSNGFNAIEVYVHRVRKQIEPFGVKIRTVHGLGYLLKRRRRKGVQAWVNASEQWVSGNGYLGNWQKWCFTGMNGLDVSQPNWSAEFPVV